MAAPFPTFPTAVRANTRTSHAAVACQATSGKWWAPLFGWSSDADYIDAAGDAAARRPQAERSDAEASGSASGKASGGRGCLTEEKAKMLRKKTAECSTFHDKMYHSAIASRLASDI